MVCYEEKELILRFCEQFIEHLRGRDIGLMRLELLTLVDSSQSCLLIDEDILKLASKYEEASRNANNNKSYAALGYFVISLVSHCRTMSLTSRVIQVLILELCLQLRFDVFAIRTKKVGYELNEISVLKLLRSYKYE